MKLWCDLETYSPIDIKNGTHAYAEKAEVLLFAIAVDDGPVQVFDFTNPEEDLETLAGLLSDADEIWFHNSHFDRTVLQWAQPKMHALMPPHKWFDTMVQALCHGLPGSLDALSEIFQLGDQGKDKRGKQLIQLFCKPKKDGTRNTRETHPAEWEEFKEYAKRDIIAMRAAHRKMPKWNYPNNEFELKLWHLDQEINMSGVYVDVELAQKAVEAVNAAQTELARAASEATDGEVHSATQRDALLAHLLSAHGVTLPDLRADTIERRIQDPDLPAPVKELLNIRLMASTASVSKYKRLLKGVSSDGYLRGIIQFAGAARTARDAGRLFQPQNLMRPTLKAEEIEDGIDAIKAGCPELVTDNVMELCANAMRGVIIAPPGKKLVVADLSNIEGRVAAWVAGELWKLQAFRDFDAGTGPDLYIKAYSESFNVPLNEVTKALRQIGKVEELMLQYEGGVGAFLTGAATYGINLDELAATGRAAIPADVWEEACGFWDWTVEQGRTTFGLSHDTFCVCDSIKRLWRRSNSAISSIWKELKEAGTAAINRPGQTFQVRKVAFRRDGNWLRLVLPSGRSLCYPSPRVEDDGRISFMGVNQYTRKWERVYTYGGKWFENLCQAIARDVFKDAYPRIVQAGYEVKIPIHDELLTYAPDTPEYSAEGLGALMATQPAWAQDLPLAAAGFETYRYRKD